MECHSSLGKKHVALCYPSTKKEQITLWQQETEDLVGLLSVGEIIPLSGISDIESILKKLRIKQVLTPEELLQIAISLQATKNLKHYFSLKQDGFKLKRIISVVEKLTENEDLRKVILKSVREDGYILDSASSNLSDIRHEMTNLNQTIRKKMEHLVKNQSMQDLLQEQIITIRSERLVIAVKAGYRNKVPGIVHDQSASGATLYIEPAEFVPLNNRVGELYQNEKKEIYIILKSLTEECAMVIDQLKNNQYQQRYLDFTTAKAKLAIKMHAMAPQTVDSTDIYLSRAYHPLLNRQEAVPITIAMTDDTRMIVVTGPNTGGKTVTLKTVGLLVLMHQSGLHIPVHSESVLGIFEKVFVDIGDEQSIEQSLSTFSSHLKNICKIVDEIDEASLALYDELGSGTDPGEGAALAISILNHNLKVGCKVLATTHYSELKTFAYQTDGVVNASMIFDVETLQPTYQLVLGVSGESNAFAIAKRIGLNEKIIKNAINILEENQSEMINKVQNLEKLQRQLQEEQRLFEEEKKQLKYKQDEVEKKLIEIETYKDKVYKEANAEAIVLLEKTKKEIQEISVSLKEARKQDHLQASLSLANAKKTIDKKIERTKPTQKYRNNQVFDLNKAKVGDEVYLNNFQTNATILAINLKKKLLDVQAGIMKLTVKSSDVSNSTNVKKPQTVTTRRHVSNVKAIHSEIDLRGMTVDDALRVTDRFIDEAYLNNLNQVRIIHGKGTGALRQAIKEALSSSKYIKQHYFAPANEGGDGATVVILK